MIKPSYTYIENASLDYLISNFDTVFIKVSYINHLDNLLSKLKEKQFNTSFAKEDWKWHWVKSCLNNHEDITIDINVKNKSVDTISYQHIISELAEPHFWSEKKIKNLGRIVICKNCSYN